MKYAISRSRTLLGATMIAALALLAGCSGSLPAASTGKTASATGNASVLPPPPLPGMMPPGSY
jgi:hypothetical protein